MSRHSSDQRVDGETVDRLLSALSNGCNRYVLDHFRQSAEDVASLQELAEHAASQGAGRGGTDTDSVAAYLHHVGLPKLAETGVIDYDSRRKTVRYWGHRRLEEDLQAVVEVGDVA